MLWNVVAINRVVLNVLGGVVATVSMGCGSNCAMACGSYRVN